MLSASHWLLAQARFCGHMLMPLSLNSTIPTVQVIFRYLQLDAPVFNITTVGMVTFRQSPCWYYPWADVILSTSSDTQHLWTWWHFGDHTGLINLSTTSAVFTPAGHVSILHCPFIFSTTNVFHCFCSTMTQFVLIKHIVRKLDYVVRSSAELSNHTKSEAMHNMSVHQLPQYYQPQQIDWTALIHVIHALKTSKGPKYYKTYDSALWYTKTSTRVMSNSAHLAAAVEYTVCTSVKEVWAHPQQVSWIQN